jgi:hypothetical protein
MQSFYQVNGSQIIMPIISLNILNVDNSNLKNIETFNQFENNIDFILKTNNTIKRPYKHYTISINTGQNNSIELDKSILVYKIDMQNIGELFVTLSDSTHDLRASYYNENNYFKSFIKLIFYFHYIVYVDKR